MTPRQKLRPNLILARFLHCDYKLKEKGPGRFMNEFSMENQFSTDYSATVAFGTPPRNFNSNERLKNQLSSTSASACAQLLHYAHSRFWPKSASVSGPRYLRALGKPEGGGGGGRGKKILVKSFSPNFVERAIKPLGKIFRTKKTD